MNDGNSEFIKAASAKNNFDLRVKRAFLESHGIPVRIVSDAANDLFGFSNVPLMSRNNHDPFAILVPAEDLEATQNLLSGIPDQSAEAAIQIALLDWKHDVFSVGTELPENSADDLIDMTNFRFLGETEADGKTWQFFITEKSGESFNLENPARFEPIVKLFSRNPGFYAAYKNFMLDGYEPPSGIYEVFGFCGEPRMATKLGKLVLDGKKTGTASLFLDYEKEQVPLPKLGGISIVVDGRGKTLCAIETTDIQVVPFNEVGTEHAKAEGEGDSSLDYWRKSHKKFFSGGRDKLPPFTEADSIVCERFRIVKRF